MQLDLTRYRAILPQAKTLVDRYPEKSKLELASILTQTTMAPIAVSSYFIGYISGFNDELEVSIKSLVSFYKYDNIIELEEYKT